MPGTVQGGISFDQIMYFATLVGAVLTIVAFFMGIVAKRAAVAREIHSALSKRIDELSNEMHDKLEKREANFVAFQLEVAKNYTPVAAMVQLRQEMNEHFSQIREDIAALGRNVVRNGRGSRG